MIRHHHVALQQLSWLRPAFATFVAIFCCLPSMTSAQSGSGGFFPSGRQTGSVPPQKLIDRARQREAGRKLFLRNWLTQGRVNTTGDGLGPIYNDVSCVACHKDGGSAKNDKNVDILSLRRPPMRSSKPLRFPLQFIDRAALKIHPGFNPDVTIDKTKLVLVVGKGTRIPLSPANRSRARTSFTLHKVCGTDRDSRSRYAKFRKAIVSSPKQRNADLAWWRTVKRMHGVTIEITQRSTPALHGAGLIDRVPASLIINTARRQRKLHRGITGRVSQTPLGQVGRFGWRGQTATLHDFVLGACANELGLTVPTIDQPDDIAFDKKKKRWTVSFASQLRSFPSGGGNSFGGGTNPNLDLTEAQCKSLTAFVASLPAPHQARKLALPLAKEVARGGKLFEKVGCAVCHVPDMKPAFGIYSDLLLHDMGPRLSDSLTAIPEINGKTAPGFTGINGYYGSEALPQIAKITTNVMQEWRTPPLWGVADSAPYMHDGRAQTLDEAILWHGGEARGSLRKYKRLGKFDRRRVVMFLESLVAPGSTAQPGGLNSGGGLGGGLGSGGGFFNVMPQANDLLTQSEQFLKPREDRPSRVCGFCHA